MTRTDALLAASSQSQVGPDNPWPGLLPFTEGDHAYFFGRETETEDLRALVLRARLTLLFGLSGETSSEVFPEEAILLPQISVRAKRGTPCATLSMDAMPVGMQPLSSRLHIENAAGNFSSI